jgi:hypothetical protein
LNFRTKQYKNTWIEIPTVNEDAVSSDLKKSTPYKHLEPFRNTEENSLLSLLFFELVTPDPSSSFAKDIVGPRNEGADKFIFCTTSFIDALKAFQIECIEYGKLFEPVEIKTGGTDVKKEEKGVCEIQ